jgi:hypothetical protein
MTGALDPGHLMAPATMVFLYPDDNTGPVTDRWPSHHYISQVSPVEPTPARGVSLELGDHGNTILPRPDDSTGE